MKFTEVRRSVFSLLCSGHKAVSAYDLAASLGQEYGRRVTPTTVYRALEFLLEQGLVAHLATTLTYVLRRPSGVENPLFFVCSKCSVVTQRQDLAFDRILRLAASKMGFNARSRAIDVEGLCKRCVQ